MQQRPLPSVDMVGAFGCSKWRKCSFWFAVDVECGGLNAAPSYVGGGGVYERIVVPGCWLVRPGASGGVEASR